MKWRTIGVVAFLLLWLRVTAAGDLTVATYNVENYTETGRRTEFGYQLAYPKSEYAKAALRRVIRGLGVDVLVLQEMGGEGHLRELQRDLAREGLDYPYSAWAAGQDPDRHLALLSRVQPLATVAHDEVAYPGRKYPGLVRRGVLEASFPLGPEKVTLFVFHLKSRGGRNQADPESAVQRGREAEAVRDLVLRRRPEIGGLYLLLGDANDTQRSRPLAALSAKGSREIARALLAADDRGEVWTHAYAREGVYSRIDYLLASPDLRRRVAGGRAHIFSGPEVAAASDHRPVWVRLSAVPGETVSSEGNFDGGAVEVAPTSDDAVEESVGSEPVRSAQ